MQIQELGIRNVNWTMPKKSQNLGPHESSLEYGSENTEVSVEGLEYKISRNLYHLHEPHIVHACKMEAFYELPKSE